MSRAKVLDVGNCDPDHFAIRRVLEANFEVEIDRVMFVDEALESLESGKYALVLVNRKIFADDSDGMELIRRMHENEGLSATPVMLVSNFPDAQQAAVAAGAKPGFGKSSLQNPRTRELLSTYLPGRAAKSRA
jgi:CheY-like chemotaxis protein